MAPPTIERLDTLEAGGAIDANALIRLAAGEPLGLRPELTASIARAAGTRLAARPRPLRLWACGSIYRSVAGEGGGDASARSCRAAWSCWGCRRRRPTGS